MCRKRIDILSLISNPNGTSGIQLSRAVGRSPAKIGELVQQLLAAGILTEEEPIETSRGRRSVLLKPSRALGYLLGVDIGMANARVVVTDRQGSVLGSVEMPSHASSDADTSLAGVLAAALMVTRPALKEFWHKAFAPRSAVEASRLTSPS